jgi:prepilin-type N-terminal cleavage/methylation domain-containing protein
MRARRRERGLTMVEMLIALALLGFMLLGVLPLFLGSVQSNFSANEYTSIHNLCRDRLEQLLNVPWNDTQLDPGVHPNDLPPVLPDPATGVPPALGGVKNPFTLSYQVMEFQVPNTVGVPNGGAFTPQRVSCGSCVITAAGVPFHYKRIDVTVQSSTGPLGLGARVARISGIVMNPNPGLNLSVADPGP